MVAFRRAWLAGRLGLDETEVPDDPAHLVHSLQLLDRHGGGLRTADDPISSADPPDPATPAGQLDVDVWNPDGSRGDTFDPVHFLAGLSAAARAELEQDLPTV